MHSFVMGSNNSVIALLTEDDYLRLQDGTPLEHGFFLFTPDNTTNIEPWFHGTHGQMNILLAGADVVHKDLYVPFSNGAQLYANFEPSGQSLIERLDQLASWSSLLQVFGPDAWHVYYETPAVSLAV